MPHSARLVIHGGSGSLDRSKYPPERIQHYREGLRDALSAGNKVLAEGGDALDAVVTAVRTMEDNPLFNCGKGAVFDISGKHDLEASVAVSRSPDYARLSPDRKGAAVTLLKHVKNPILLAKQLYLDEESCPHAFVSGADAERIAGEKGLERVDEHYFDTAERWREHLAGLENPKDPFPPLKAQNGAPPTYEYEDEKMPIDLQGLPKGTVGAVALDSKGMLACATSTGGKTNKNVGRIGDTPSMGSGFYCSSWNSKPSRLARLLTFGAKSRSPARGVAVSGTGDGDYFIRNSTAYSVASRMEWLGFSLEKAGKKAIAVLKGQNGVGGLIAVDAAGNFTMPFNCSSMFRGVITPQEGIPRVAAWAGESLTEVR